MMREREPYFYTSWDQNLRKLTLEPPLMNTYFSVKKNIPYERSVFHNSKQDSNESIEQFVTRLRKLSMHCEYGNQLEQHRDQIISSCQSKFRKRLLSETDLTLAKTIQIGQLMENAAHQTKQIDEQNNGVQETVNHINQQSQRQQPNRGRGHHRPYHRYQGPRNQSRRREFFFRIRSEASLMVGSIIG